MNLVNGPGGIILPDAIPQIPLLGACDRILALTNWFLSAKAFQFHCELAGFTGDIGPWNFTDPDGDGSPGTNPANLNAYLASQNLANTDYWLNQVHALLPINIHAVVGDVNLQITNLSADVWKNAGDGLYYAACDRLAINGATPSSWQIDTLLTFGGGPQADFLWATGDANLQPYTDGDGASGTIALVATDWW